MPSGSLRCKNIPTFSKDLLNLLEVPLEKSEGYGEVILVETKGNFHEKVILGQGKLSSTNLKLCSYPQVGPKIDGKEDGKSTINSQCYTVF